MRATGRISDQLRGALDHLAEGDPADPAFSARVAAVWRVAVPAALETAALVMADAEDPKTRVQAAKVVLDAAARVGAAQVAAGAPEADPIAALARQPGEIPAARSRRRAAPPAQPPPPAQAAPTAHADEPDLATVTALPRAANPYA